MNDKIAGYIFRKDNELPLPIPPIFTMNELKASVKAGEISGFLVLYGKGGCE